MHCFGVGFFRDGEAERTCISVSVCVLLIYERHVLGVDELSGVNNGGLDRCSVGFVDCFRDGEQVLLHVAVDLINVMMW